MDKEKGRGVLKEDPEKQWKKVRNAQKIDRWDTVNLDRQVTRKGECGRKGLDQGYVLLQICSEEG